DCQRQRPGDPAQAQLAVDDETVRPQRLDPLGDEAGLRPASGVEQAAGQGGAVPVLVAQVQALQRHPHVQAGAAPVLRIELEGALAAGHRAQGLGEAGVGHGEHDPGVDRVQGVAGRLGRGRGGQQDQAPQQGGSGTAQAGGGWGHRRHSRHKPAACGLRRPPCVATIRNGVDLEDVMRLFWLCLLLALSGVLHAAVPELPRFRVLGPGDGLPSTTVGGIARDHDGYLWVATWDGLARYDGVGFQVWQHDPENPSSLPGNLIQALYVDGRNRIWVATEGGGVSVMDTRRDGLQHYRRATHPQLESADVFTNTGRGDGIWVGTVGGGLYRIDGEGELKRMRARDPEIDATLDRAIMGISMDQEGQTILVATLNGLAHCADKTSKVRRLPLPGGDPYPPVTALWRDGKTTWVGTPQGLYRMRDDGSWETPSWAPQFSARRAVTAMSGDGQGGYWVATTSGLWHVPASGVPVAVGHGPDMPAPSSTIQAML